MYHLCLATDMGAAAERLRPDIVVHVQWDLGGLDLVFLGIDVLWMT